MKRKMILLLGVMVLALGLVGTPASWANSLPFQGVTFYLNIVGNTLQLGISSATGTTGDWATANGFAGFSLKNVGTNDNLQVTGGTFTITADSGQFDLTNNTFKALFTKDGSIDGNVVDGKVGTLLSANIPVPE